MTLFARLTLAIALIASCSTALADGVTPFCDVLYWHASAEPSSVWSNAAYEGSSFSAENVQFDWNPGFRVGFGHKLDEESWDVKLYWTYFHTSQDANVSVGAVPVRRSSPSPSAAASAAWSTASLSSAKDRSTGTWRTTRSIWKSEGALPSANRPGFVLHGRHDGRHPARRAFELRTSRCHIAHRA